MGTPVSPAELRSALDRFDALMRGKAREADFQRLFADCPYILSRSLPLGVEPSEIVPLGRPGKSEPDFVAFPERATPLSTYGIIELKRPDAPILTQPRKGTLVLTRDAQTAVAQSEVYARAREEPTVAPPHVLMLGNSHFIFIIMGLRDELTARLGSQLYADQVNGLLPGNCRLIPYDTLKDVFTGTVPPKLMVLVPRLPDLRGSSPSFDDISTSLRLLGQHALRTWWILEVGQPLLALERVRAEIPSDAVDDPIVSAVSALRIYLGEAISRVEDPSHRTLLEIVLGAGDSEWANKEWREESAEARRTAAGQLFRPEELPIRNHTLSGYHEKAAIHELALSLWHEQLQARGEAAAV